MFPCLDQLLDRPRTGEVTGENAAGRVGVLIEVLDGGRAHHRKALLQLRQIFSAEHLFWRSGTPGHDRENGITRRRTKGELSLLLPEGRWCNGDISTVCSRSTAMIEGPDGKWRLGGV